MRVGVVGVVLVELWQAAVSCLLNCYGRTIMQNFALFIAFLGRARSVM